MQWAPGSDFRKEIAIRWSTRLARHVRDAGPSAIVEPNAAVR